MDPVQRTSGSFNIWGPQNAAIASALTATSVSSAESALLLASIDGRLAGLDTNNVRLVDGTKVQIANDPLNPVPIRGFVALDPSEPVRLPTNAALEKGGNLDVIASRMPALGAALAAAAVPVTIAADQPPLAFNTNAAAEDGHLRAIRDIETSRLRVEMADFAQRAAMCGAFIPCPEV